MIAATVGVRVGGGGIAGGNDTYDGDRTRTGDGIVGMEGEDERPGLGVDDESGESGLEFEFVAVLIGRKEGAVDKDAFIDEIETPVSRALIDTCHDGAGSGLLRVRGKNRREHLRKMAEEGVASTGCRKTSGSDAAIECAGFWVFGEDGLATRTGGHGLRGRAHLVFRFFDVCVVKILLLLLESFGSGDFFGGRLLAGGKKFLEISAGDAGVGVKPGGCEVVGMSDHAHGGVGSVADVAAFDVDMFTLTDLGNANDDVLRVGDGGEEYEKKGQENFWSEWTHVGPSMVKSKSAAFGDA